MIIHKPVWRSDKSNWAKVHDLLVEFNRRPMVSIEPDGGPAGTPPAPKVRAVFAGHAHAYTQEPAKDGIDYYVLGPTGAAIDQDKLTGQMQAYTLVKVDAQGPHLALIEPGSIHAADYVTAKDRVVLEKISKLDEQTLGIVGTLEQPINKDVGAKDSNAGTLKLVLQNPLDVPLDVALRMASTKNLETQDQKDAANPFTDNFDSQWELHVPYATQHLEPGQKVAYAISLFCPAQPGEIPPPQVELLVNWIDSKGRTVPTVLKRRVPLIPSLQIPRVAGGGGKEEDWLDAVRGTTYSWIPSAYDLPKPSPDFEVLSDAQNVRFRVHVTDSRHAYYADFREPWNLPSDAVAIEFAPDAATAPAQVERIVVLPFAPEKDRLMTNTGVGKEQTALLPLDTKKYAVKTTVTARDDRYDVDITIPRTLLLAGQDACVLNLVVTDNDGQAHSQQRSWAREDLGPAAWGRVKMEAEKPK